MSFLVVMLSRWLHQRPMHKNARCKVALAMYCLSNFSLRQTNSLTWGNLRRSFHKEPNRRVSCRLVNGGNVDNVSGHIFSSRVPNLFYDTFQNQINSRGARYFRYHSSNKSHETTTQLNNVNSGSGTFDINKKISPDKQYTLRFDGGSRQNPGIAGAGMVIYLNNEEIWSGYRFVGDSATNNEAEYTALLEGLVGARQLGIKKLRVEGDSQLAIKQLKGEYRCKSPKLIPLYKQVKALVKDFTSFELQHIPRASNARADELANIAMDTLTDSDIQVGISTSSFLSNKEKSEAKLFTDQQDQKTIVSACTSHTIHPNKKYRLRFCGGSRDNIAGVSMVLYDDQYHEIATHYDIIGMRDTTNNQADYMALLKGLEYAHGVGIEQIIIEGDNFLVINQLRGEYKCKSEKLLPLYEKSKNIRNLFSDFEAIHISKDKNRRAKELLEIAMKRGHAKDLTSIY